MINVVIFGAGGHARVVADVIRAEGNNVVCFLDDNKNNKNSSGTIDDYIRYDGCAFIIGIGSSDVRERLSSLNLKWHTAVHPTAIVSPTAIIGEGTVVMPNAIVNAGTLVGKHCILNSGSIVEHDGCVGDFTHVSVGANIGGTVTIGKRCLVGIGSTIKNNVFICDDVIVGAGAAVVRDIKEHGVYVGIPVKRIKG